MCICVCICDYVYVSVFVCAHLAEKQLIKSCCCCWQIAANPNTATELPKCLLMHACCCSYSAVAVSLAQLALIVLQCHLCCRLVVVVVVVAESRKMHAKRSNCNENCNIFYCFTSFRVSKKLAKIEESKRGLCREGGRYRLERERETEREVRLRRPRDLSV